MAAVVQHVGALTIGAIVPVALTATAAATAAINASLPSLQARVAGLVQLAASLQLTPPSLSANLTAAADLLASLQAAVTLGLPGVEFQVAGVATLLATLQVQVAALEASLSLIAGIEATLGGAAVHLYSLTGPVAEVGTGVQSALAPGLPSGGGAALDVLGIMVLAGSAAGKAAIQASFRTA